jgi:hypothetical protein
MLQRARRGRAAMEHRQAGIPALVTCYGLRQPVQKIVGIKVVLTEGLGRGDSARRVVVGEVRAAGRGGARGGGRCWASPGSWIRRGDAGSCCGGVEGVRQAREPPAVSNCTAVELTFGGCQAQSRRGRGGGRGQWPREWSWTLCEAPAVTCRGWSATARRGYGGAGPCSGAEVAGMVLGFKGGGGVAR